MGTKYKSHSLAQVVGQKVLKQPAKSRILENGARPEWHLLKPVAPAEAGVQG